MARQRGDGNAGAGDRGSGSGGQGRPARPRAGEGPAVNLVLVLGDQLTPGLAALRAADRGRDVVVMAEVMAEAAAIPHHPQKIALTFAAMRHFARALREDGWSVRYTRLDDPRNSQSIPGELLRAAAATGSRRVIATACGDWRLRAAIASAPLDVTVLPDDRFLCPEADFAAWARGRRELRLEWFYRMMRRRTGLLMEGDRPAGGQWNFDARNRRPARPDLFRSPPPAFAPDEETEAVLRLVETRFPGHWGRLRPFRWGVTRAAALAAMADFMARRLPGFGATQDAMLAGDPWLNHSVLSPYLNLGLLTPAEVCAAAAAEWKAGRAPIAAAEGFIRQIIGWREYVRGIFLMKGPAYRDLNALRHRRPLPRFYRDGQTAMACLAQVVGQTRDTGYAHHIQRLMVAGNFALLAGIDPGQVHDWFMEGYIDAFDWVMAPNVIGMSQHADGGLVGSKPYVSSGAYIDRMSDYCRGCAYDVRARAGDRACPFNLLYWHFLDRHRGRFGGNPRLAPAYRTWDGMEEGHRARLRADAGRLLARLDAGQPV